MATSAYYIIEALTRSALETAVNDALGTDEPLGAPFFDDTAGKWCQAMTTPA